MQSCVIYHNTCPPLHFIPLQHILKVLNLLIPSAVSSFYQGAPDSQLQHQHHCSIRDYKCALFLTIQNSPDISFFSLFLRCKSVGPVTHLNKSWIFTERTQSRRKCASALGCGVTFLHTCLAQKPIFFSLPTDCVSSEATPH